MRKRLVVLVMLLAMLSNMFLSNNISVYAFELREGDSIEDDENYANIEFGDTELDDDDDNNGVDYGDLDYDDGWIFWKKITSMQNLRLYLPGRIIVMQR